MDPKALLEDLRKKNEAIYEQVTTQGAIDANKIRA